ncbi:hypothetical protein KR059_002257, partial [Drosophila kikkawai]
MKTVALLPVLLLLGSFCFLEAAQILCLVSSAKHNNPSWSLPLFEALLAKGHHLSVLSSSELKLTPREGLVYSHLPNDYDVMQKHFLDKETGKYQPMMALKQLLVWYEVILGSCQSIMGSETFKRLLPDLVTQVSQEFDLIITDVTEGANCLLDLVPSWDPIPVLGLSAGKLTPDLISLLQAEDTISAARTPHHLSQVPKSMGFWNRLHNHIMYLGEPIINRVIISPVLFKTVSTGKVFPKLQLVLLNTHPVVDYVQNLPPGVIEVSGLHIKQEISPLPDYIEKFTEKFIYGIVYINMPYIESIGQGIESTVRMIHDNPNCGFIWNVKEMKVLPAEMPNLLTLHNDQSLQQDILALSAVKGFLNHGDSFSVQEAVFYGVPMVVLPVNLEQFNTAQRVKERRLGVMLSAKDFHLQSFHDALQLILDVQQFTTVLYQAQQNFLARQQSPIEIAIWHAEKMIAEPRFYKHLAQVEAIEQNFFVAHSLDVLAVPFLLFLFFVLNLLSVISKLIEAPKKKELKKRKKIKKVVEKTMPVNNTILEQNVSLMEDLKEELFEGEIELLSENQSDIPKGVDE